MRLVKTPILRWLAVILATGLLIGVYGAVRMHQPANSSCSYGGEPFFILAVLSAASLIMLYARGLIRRKFSHIKSRVVAYFLLTALLLSGAVALDSYLYLCFVW